MATLKLVLVPAKALKDGRHKVRISVAHNSETRYILTDVIVDSDKEFRQGSIVRRPDAAMLNTKLRGVLQKYQELIDGIPYIEGLSCAELIEVIKSIQRMSHPSLQTLFEEFINSSSAKQSTLKQYGMAWNTISRCINTAMPAESLTLNSVSSLTNRLSKLSISPATIRIYLTVFRSVINFAVQGGYVSFRINPFWGYKAPALSIRQSWLSVDEIKRIRDYQTDSHALRRFRDMFMLSYYLGGINVADLVGVNFNNTATLKYQRVKTIRQQKSNKYVEFTIAPEARAIIEQYKAPDGILRKFCPGKKPFTTEEIWLSINNSVSRCCKLLGAELGIPNLVYYSARKSFSQHAFELGINTRVIDYILGHSLGKAGTSLYHYVEVTPQMATEAIRKVLDNLK